MNSATCDTMLVNVAYKCRERHLESTTNRHHLTSRRHHHFDHVHHQR